MRILVVEDDQKIATFVAGGLRQAGFAVDHGVDDEAGADQVQTSLCCFLHSCRLA
jgi:two-component system, OmpR family, response regulator